jgi:hypothetical protein
MVINAIIFKEYETMGISINGGSNIGGHPHTRVLWTGFSLLLKCCVDARK